MLMHTFSEWHVVSSNVGVHVITTKSRLRVIGRLHAFDQ